MWERARAGRHTVVAGRASVPPLPSDLKVLEVSCAAPRTTGGPLDAARRKVEKLLGEDGPFSDHPLPMTELRQRLLDDLPVRFIDAVLVEECNRLADRTEGHAVLCFESIDAANQATLETLMQILRRPGWLRLPLILTVPGTLGRPIAELAEVLRRADGTEALIEIEAATAAEAEASFDWMTLPADVLRVLRAGSVLGSTLEAELIARLLDEPPGAVLEKLQCAADAGAPLADRGEGRFSLPVEAVQILQSRILPSLLIFWHERLGELLGNRQPVEKEAPIEPSAQVDIEAGQLPSGYEALFEPPARPSRPQAEPPATEPAVSGVPLSGQPASVQEPAPTSRPPQDPARAATHLQAAGRTEAAVERYLAAVRRICWRASRCKPESVPAGKTMPTRRVSIVRVPPSGCIGSWDSAGSWRTCGRPWDGWSCGGANWSWQESVYRRRSSCSARSAT